MKSFVLGWLLGLPIVALIWGLAIQGERQGIIGDLQQRTNAALVGAELDWATSTFDITEGRVTGAAYSEDERVRALDIARRVWGTWDVRDETALVEEAPSYIWGATLDGGNLQLTGFVPNERVRRDILDTARASFPDRSVRDDMRPARGAPAGDIWIDGINFGLRQLVQLKPGGRVDLKGTQLGISGEAESSTAYRSIYGDVERRLPNGILLAQNNVTPPHVSVFTWSAAHKAGQLELTGHVPPGAARDQLVDIAKAAFPDAAIVDRMTAASGAPDNWMSAAGAVLRELAKLEAADGRIEGQRVTIAGLAVTEATADAAGHGLKVGLPSGYVLDQSIKFREPTLPTITPFTTRFIADGGRISLTGYISDESTRLSLTSTIRRLFGAREIIDNLTYANGAPPGWLTCAEAAVNALAKLDQGRAEMSDATLKLSGRTRDETMAATLPAEVRASANRACKDTTNITYEAPPEPRLKWQVLNIEGRLELSGSVIDSNLQAELREAAVKLFPKHEIVDNTRIEPASSAKWHKVVRTGLDQLAKLRSGLARLDGYVLTVDGIAGDTAAANLVKSRVVRGLPAGYTGQAMIEVKSDAMIWSEKEAKRKSDAGTQDDTQAKTDAAERAASLAEVQKRAAEAATQALAEAQARQRAALAASNAKLAAIEFRQ